MKAPANLGAAGSSSCEELRRPPISADAGRLDDQRSERPARSEFRLLAVLSVVVGSLLLLDNFGVLTGVHRLWPAFPALAGTGMLLAFRQQRRRGDLVLVGIGSYLVGVSIVFFVCEFSSWMILARAWPIFVALLGISSAIASFFASRTRMVLAASGVLLVLVAGVFLLVIQVNPGLWPISLILFGIWALVLATARRRIERSLGAE